MPASVRMSHSASDFASLRTLSHTSAHAAGGSFARWSSQHDGSAADADGLPGGSAGLGPLQTRHTHTLSAVLSEGGGEGGSAAGAAPPGSDSESNDSDEVRSRRGSALRRPRIAAAPPQWRRAH